jgi:hypothetical protein
MKALLQFLIIKTDSMNGLPGSVRVLREMNLIRKDTPTKTMLPRIYNNFFLMKIRMKISFEACT